MKQKVLIILVAIVYAHIVTAQTSDYSSYLVQAWECLHSENCEAAQRNYNVYKELSGDKNASLEEAISNCKKQSTPAKYIPQGYVDLDLPSGTLWKDDNEKGYYTYEQAVRQFGPQLPTKNQLEELVSKCTWEWKGGGYIITGKNGKSIYLAAAGLIPWTLKDNQVCRVGDTGVYASGTPYTSAGSKDLYGLFFGRGMIKVAEMGGTNKISVRLVYLSYK